MHAIRRTVFLFLACVGLASCVLQSKVPLYQDGDGTLLLKPYGAKMLLQFLDHDEWRTEQDALTFAAEGRHYLVTGSDADKKAKAIFSDLGHGMTMLQFSEEGKPATYVLVQAQKDAVLLRPLMCDALKKSQQKSAVVTFQDNGCVIGAKPTADDLKAWLTALGPARMRLKPVR